jgi:hypothetical protein
MAVLFTSNRDSVANVVSFYLDDQDLVNLSLINREAHSLVTKSNAAWRTRGAQASEREVALYFTPKNYHDYALSRRMQIAYAEGVNQGPQVYEHLIYAAQGSIIFSSISACADLPESFRSYAVFLRDYLVECVSFVKRQEEMGFWESNQENSRLSRQFISHSFALVPACTKLAGHVLLNDAFFRRVVKNQTTQYHITILLGCFALGQGFTADSAVTAAVWNTSGIYLLLQNTIDVRPPAINIAGKICGGTKANIIRITEYTKRAGQSITNYIAGKIHQWMYSLSPFSNSIG